MKEGTRPQIYATATYLAVKELEELKTGGYTYVAASYMGNSPSIVTLYDGTPRKIIYTEDSVREYVSYSGGTFVYSASPTEYIRITETVSNDENSDVVSLWTILIKDFYDPVVNPVVMP